MCISGTSAANPVLGSSKAARQFSAPAAALQQNLVHFAKQTIAERKASAQTIEAVLQSRSIIRNLKDIIYRNSRRLLQLVEHQISK